LSNRLGSGHFGDVYLCDHTLLGHRSALKVIPVKASDTDALALEAKLLNLSTHPHIVKVRSAGYWTAAGSRDYFLIEMEYVPGGSLQDAIAREISIGELLPLMKNVLFALDHAHPDVIHRDVKPANILLGGGGKLSDFGIAMVSATGASASKLHYNLNLAPECLSPTKTFNVATDIFAAGLALLRSLNLIADWRATLNSVPSVRAKMAQGALLKELRFHPRVPPALVRVVRRACASDPAKRYATASDFRDALEALKVERDWRRAGADLWESEGGAEQLVIAATKSGYAADYLRKRRRKSAFHKDGLSREAAERYVYEVIAATTLR